MPGAWPCYKMLRGQMGPDTGGLFTGIAAASALAAGLAAFAPLAFKFLMDAAVRWQDGARSDTAGPEVWALAYAGALALTRIVSEFRSLIFGAAEQKLVRGLGRGAFSHALRLPAEYHSGRSTGEIQQVLDNGVQGCRTLLQHALLTAGPGLIELAFMAAIILFWLDAVFFALFAAFAAAYGAAFALTARAVVGAAGRVSEARIDANAWLADGLMNQDVVRACCGSVVVTAEYDLRLARAQSAWAGLYRARLRAGLLTALVMAGGLSAALLIALAGVRAGDRSAGDVILIHAAMLQAARPLELLAGALRDAGQAVAFTERLASLLQQAPEAPESDGPAPLQPGSPEAIRFENVSFAHPGGPKVIDDVSFEVPAGSKAAIVGPSGSGKSTLLRLILRFHEPQEGQILLGGIPSANDPPEAVRRRVTAILQEGGLFNASVAFNIAFPGEESDPERLAALASAAGLGPLLSSLPGGLEYPIGERGMRLSGGERQRLVLARALGRRTGILVADEPASALDPASRERVRRLLYGAGTDQTVIVVSHNLPDVCGADLLLVMYGGRLVEQGTHAELLSLGGIYAQMWQKRA